MKSWLKSALRRAWFVHGRVAGRAPVLIVSTRRSGSTWVAEVLARAARACLVDQPFSYFHLGARRPRLDHFYVHGVPRQLSPEVACALTQELIEYGRQRHPPNANWMPLDGMARRSERVVFKELDAKFLGAVPEILMRCRVIALRRAPDDTVASIMRQGWGDYVDGYLGQPDYVATLRPDQRRVAQRVVASGDTLARQYLSWCFEDRALSAVAATAGVLEVDYEALLSRPADEFAALARHCDIDSQRISDASMQRRSRTAQPGRRQRVPRVAPRRTALCNEVLESFGHS